MNDIGRSVETIFDESVENVFRFLVDEYGFSFVKDSQASHTARTKDCEIMISYDLPLSIFVQIKPPYYHKPYLDLRHIVKYYDPKFNAIHKVVEQDGIVAEMEDLAKLLIKYCSPMLKGDLAEWHKIESKKTI